MSAGSLVLHVGSFTVQISRVDNTDAALASLLETANVRLISTNPDLVGYVNKVYVAYRVARSDYKQTQWFYSPCRFDKQGHLTMSRVSSAARYRMWLIVDKHNVRLSAVGMRQAPLADIIKKCKEIATNYITRYNTVVDGGVFNVVISCDKGGFVHNDVIDCDNLELPILRNTEVFICKGIIASTADHIAQYVADHTPVIVPEFDEVVAAIRNADLSPLAHVKAADA